MQRISRAPVLSATLSRVSCWIISPLPRLLDDLDEAPVLGLRERTRLDDPDDVTGRSRVALVVCVQPMAAPHDLLVLRVRLGRLHLDDDRLVALVGDDHTPTLLAPADRRLRLGRSNDRRALGRALARRLRVRVAKRARKTLALPLLAHGGGGRLLRRARRGSG